MASSANSQCRFVSWRNDLAEILLLVLVASSAPRVGEDKQSAYSVDSGICELHKTGLAALQERHVVRRNNSMRSQLF